MKIVGALVAALLFAIPAAPAATSQRVTIDRALDVSVLQRVNEVRAENGLPPLRLSESLSRAAAAHTREIGVPTGTCCASQRMSWLRSRTHPCDGRPGISWGRLVPWRPTTPPPGQSLTDA